MSLLLLFPQPTGGGGTSYSLTLSGGTISVTGGSSTLAHGKSLSLAGGTIAVTGGSATLARNRSLSLSGGTIAVTGGDATLSKTGAQAYSLSLVGGTINVTGGDAGLTHSTPAAASTAPSGVRKRKRYIINDKFYELSDAELRNALETIISEQPELVIEKPKKSSQKRTVKVLGPSVPKEVRQYIQNYPDLSGIYAQVQHHIRTREILHRIAWERMLDQEDEEILLLL